MAFLRENPDRRAVARRRWPSGGPILIALAMAGIAGLGAAAGCGDKPEGGLARLNARGEPFLSGVPVPEGFSLVDRNTEDYESGGRRWARHCYRGRADQFAVRNFYREQMPLLGWNLISDQNVKGVMTIRFENPDEACTIQIERDGMFNRCTVQAILMPLSRVTAEPPPRQPVP